MMFRWVSSVTFICFLAFGAAHAFATGLGGPNVALTGDALAYVQHTDGDDTVSWSELENSSPGNAIDGDSSTYWQVARGSTARLIVAFRDGLEKVNRIRIHWGNDRIPDYSVLYASENLYVPDRGFPPGELTSFESRLDDDTPDIINLADGFYTRRLEIEIVPGEHDDSTDPWKITEVEVTYVEGGVTPTEGIWFVPLQRGIGNALPSPNVAFGKQLIPIQAVADVCVIEDPELDLSCALDGSQTTTLRGTSERAIMLVNLGGVTRIKGIKIWWHTGASQTIAIYAHKVGLSFTNINSYKLIYSIDGESGETVEDIQRSSELGLINRGIRTAMLIFEFQQPQGATFFPAVTQIEVTTEPLPDADTAGANNPVAEPATINHYRHRRVPSAIVRPLTCDSEALCLWLGSDYTEELVSLTGDTADIAQAFIDADPEDTDVEQAMTDMTSGVQSFCLPKDTDEEIVFYRKKDFIGKKFDALSGGGCYTGLTSGWNQKLWSVQFVGDDAD